MTLQTDLDAANAKIADDSATLAADTAARDAIQAKIDAAGPHLDLIAKVRAELQTLKAAVSDAVDAVEANIEPLLDQIVTLIVGE